MNIEYNSDLIIGYLKKEGISKTKFCKDCHISISTLNKMLCGKNISLLSVSKIAKKMKLNLCEFFIDKKRL